MSALPPLQPETSPRTRRKGRFIVVAILLVALLGFGAWYLWGRSASGTPANAADATKSGKAGKGGGGKAGGGRFGGDPNRAQPVAVADAKTGDLNIVQTALGTVTATRTATVRPRVDGLLQSVSFTEGQFVKAGDPLAQIDPAPFQVALAQAEGQLARDAASLNNARLDLERYRTLLAQDSAPAQQVDQQASLVKQLEGTVKMDQAQLDNAKLQLSWTRITAPIAGQTGLRQVDPGNMVRSADTTGLVVITQVDPITALFTIPQDALPRVLARIKKGDKPPVQAWDRGQKSMLAAGTLLSADNQIDVTTGTVKMKAQFANGDSKLFPNQFVNVRMVVDVLRGTVIVPSAAIQRDNQGTIVYAVQDDSTVAVRRVQLGPSEGEITAVASGLKAGERVIVDGVDRVREGAKVEVIQPAAPGTARASRAPGQAADPQAREDFKKRLENMTPEQREAFRKRREAGKAQGQAQ
jgi:multidrug efflux system membrane fusion protein